MFKGKPNLQKMDLKRLYLPGVTLEENCPHCKKDFTVDMEEHYPYSFKENGECMLSFLCPHCEESVNKNVVLEITLKDR